MVSVEKDDNEIVVVMFEGTDKELLPVSAKDNVDPNFGDAPWLLVCLSVSTLVNIKFPHFKPTNPS